MMPKTQTMHRTGCFEAQVESEGSGAEQAFFCTEFQGENGHCCSRKPPEGTVSRKKCTRVLIIEDNVDAAESLRDLFLLGNRQVEVAYDGATGIAKAERFHPDLVMCDIALPGMDGYQVARFFRDASSLSGSRILAWTGYSRPEDIRRCAEAGFHGYMAKPLTPDQLNQLLSYADQC
jgi:CheY-like chemotaxis protein